MACERLDRKLHRAARGQRQARGLKIDIDLGARMLEQPLRGRFVHHNGQQAVLQGIAAENIGDLGADDCAKSVIKERPGRVLARGSAAKIASGHQDFRAAGFGPIQDEIRIRRAIG